MTEHWCTFCQGVNAHNCQFNPNIPRQRVYVTNSTAHPAQAGQVPAWTTEQITAVAQPIAMAIAENCRTAPQLVFPHLFLGLKDLLTGTAPQQAEVVRWRPDVCPITGKPFFMWIDHPKHGSVPTYGGPYDSYTIPVRDDYGSFCCERYDHDNGWWVIDEVVDVGVQIVSDQAYVSDTEPQQAEAVPTLYDPKHMLAVFDKARNGSTAPSGYARGITAVIAAWEAGREQAEPKCECNATMDTFCEACTNYRNWKQPQAKAVPEGYKLLKDTTHQDRSWPEDATHENGCYHNTCVNCLRGFTGHKRRGICRSCDALTKP